MVFAAPQNQKEVGVSWPDNQSNSRDIDTDIVSTMWSYPHTLARTFEPSVSPPSGVKKTSVEQQVLVTSTILTHFGLEV